jgi:hypothetical protein
MIRNNMNLQPGGLSNHQLPTDLNITQQHYTEEVEEEEVEQMNMTQTSDTSSETTTNQNSSISLSKNIIKKQEN